MDGAFNKCVIAIQKKIEITDKANVKECVLSIGHKGVVNTSFATSKTTTVTLCFRFFV